MNQLISLSSDKELLFYAEYHRVMGPKIVAIECEGHERNLDNQSKNWSLLRGLENASSFTRYAGACHTSTSHHDSSIDIQSGPH